MEEYCVMCDAKFFSWRYSDTHCESCVVFNSGYNAYRHDRPCQPPAKGLTEYGIKLWTNGYLAAASIAKDEREREIREEVEILQAVEKLIAVGTDPEAAKREKARDRKRFAREAQSSIAELTKHTLKNDPSSKMIAKQAARAKRAEQQEFEQAAQAAIDELCADTSGHEAPAKYRLRQTRLVRCLKLICLWPLVKLMLGKDARLPWEHPGWHK